MAAAKSSIPAERVALYDKLVAAHPQMERKGAAMPYTSVNGHMFSFLTASGVLALRLPEEAREAFLAKHNARLCEQHGVVLKEYVEVPDSLLSKAREMQKYFELSYDYVAALKPKATTRKKKKK